MGLSSSRNRREDRKRVEKVFDGAWIVYTRRSRLSDRKIVRAMPKAVYKKK